ncbi:hypothetical protein [Kaistia sp. MMO-174]|uniref:hypothetical protein n=1 Tax=Kaistia sp. MMO-174 TaxID=3081256 RepID=UPI003019C063
MSYFATYGPYEIPRSGGKINGRQSDFWRGIEELPDSEGISTAIGCYLFCIRHGEKIRPWYVGMTRAKLGFRGEIFQEHKQNIYNDCLKKQTGRPVIFLFPLITDGSDRFSKAASSKRREIEWLEIQLMGFAHRRNPNISNVRDMSFLRNIEVLGLIGRRRGRPFREAQLIRKALLV